MGPEEDSQGKKGPARWKGRHEWIGDLGTSKWMSVSGVQKCQGERRRKAGYVARAQVGEVLTSN